jgi:hypothetical protein
MFDHKKIPHRHIGDKAIRNDNNTDDDGVIYTDEEIIALETPVEEITSESAEEES